MLLFHSFDQLFTTAIAARCSEFFAPVPLLAVVEAKNAPILLTGILLSLVVIYLASKIGAEIIVRVIITTFLAPPFLRIAFNRSSDPLPEIE